VKSFVIRFLVAFVLLTIIDKSPGFSLIAGFLFAAAWPAVAGWAHREGAGEARAPSEPAEVLAARLELERVQLEARARTLAARRDAQKKLAGSIADAEAAMLQAGIDPVHIAEILGRA
jgi:hypothetical protein